MTLEEALKLKKESKYHNQKVELDGILFDSKREAHRWIELKYMERAKLITDLKRQVPFELIPAYGKRPGERAIKYIADFTYFENGKMVVEDAKGVKTDVYKIKKRIMRWRYGIEIKEV